MPHIYTWNLPLLADHDKLHYLDLKKQKLSKRLDPNWVGLNLIQSGSSRHLLFFLARIPSNCPLPLGQANYSISLSSLSNGYQPIWPKSAGTKSAEGRKFID